VCEPVARKHCWQTYCEAECATKIVIQDCMYVDFTVTASGGAIFIGKTNAPEFWLLRCQFYRCGAGGRGGSVCSSGTRCEIVSFVGVDSFAGDAGTCTWVEVGSSGAGTCSINESSSLRASGAKGTFYSQFTGYDAAGDPAVTHLVNATGNRAGALGTAVGLGGHYAAKIHFCQFYSNYDGAALYLGTSGSQDDYLRCVDFYNNTAKTAEVALILAVSVVTFNDCCFVRNPVTYLAGPADGKSTATVTFSHCVFDTQSVTIGTGVALTHLACETRAGATIFERRTCLLNPPPEDEDPGEPGENPGEPGNPANPGNAGESNSNNSNAALYGGIGGAVAAVAAIAAVAAFFLLRRKPRLPDEPVAQELEETDKNKGHWDVEHPDQEYIEEENPLSS
jgi:hypothetical protein